MNRSRLYKALAVIIKHLFYFASYLKTTIGKYPIVINLQNPLPRWRNQAFLIKLKILNWVIQTLFGSTNYPYNLPVTTI